MDMDAMQQKQRCLNVIERFPQEQLAHVAESLEVMYKMMEEMLDEQFCMSLLESHRKRNPAHIEEDFSPIEEVANRLGVHLNAN